MKKKITVLTTLLISCLGFAQTNNCATAPTDCNLVYNGDFEQKSSLPDNFTQINRACNWLNHTSTGVSRATGTSDYFHAETVNPTYVGVPTNLYGSISDANGGQAYAGYVIRVKSGSPEYYFENLKTRLVEPLKPNTQYTLSLNVARSKGAITTNTQPFQCYIGWDNLTFGGANSRDVIIQTNGTSTGIVLPQTGTSNIMGNGWNNLQFTFTTGNSAGQTHLYFGGINVQTAVSYYGSVYHYIDNVKLIEVRNFAPQLNLPETTLCSANLNLATYLTGGVTGGVFSGPGVTYAGGVYAFNPTIAGNGTHTIVYTIPGSMTCPSVEVTDVITVDSCDPSNNCNTLPTDCNLVYNGDFEQNSSIPDNFTQIDRACNWQNHRGTTDYFHAATVNPTYVGVPTNLYGSISDANGGQAYAGYVIRVNPSSPDYYFENLKTRLVEPLKPNTQYILSLNVARSGGAITNTTQPFQCYIGWDNLTFGGVNSRDVIIQTNGTSTGIVLPQTGTSNIMGNGWNNLQFSFATGNSAGQTHLYFGGINVQTGLSNYGSVYHYIDNVRLIEVQNFAPQLNLPNPVCSNSANLNLGTYLTNGVTGGVFSGPGVVCSGGVYTFNPAVAGAGSHTITYTISDPIACPPVVVTDDVIVNECLTSNISQTYVYGNNDYKESKENGEVLVYVENDMIKVTSLRKNITKAEVFDIYTPNTSGILLNKVEQINGKQVSFPVKPGFLMLSVKVLLEDGTVVNKKIRK